MFFDMIPLHRRYYGCAPLASQYELDSFRTAQPHTSVCFPSHMIVAGIRVKRGLAMYLTPYDMLTSTLAALAIP